ncbi:hypothetical protein BDR04DRAFT_1089018 [Suillus decipiens]|nr:hypothetical protein BDR04DRAFT_1089018 [Suillus decipiens]
MSAHWHREAPRIENGRPSHIVLMCVVCARSCFSMSMLKRNKRLFTVDSSGETECQTAMSTERSAHNFRTSHNEKFKTWVREDAIAIPVT